jgi:hypothetical protein
VRAAAELGYAIDVKRAIRAQASAVARGFAQIVARAYDKSDYAGLVCLSYVDTPAPAALLDEFFFPAARPGVDKSERLGFVSRAPREGNDEAADVLVFAVTDLAYAVRKRIGGKRAFKAAAERVQRALADKQAVASIMRRAGGLAAISAAQHLLCDYALADEASDPDVYAGRACEIAMHAFEVEPVSAVQPRRLFFDMFERCRNLAKEFGADDPELSLGFAATAHQVGASAQALEALADVDKSSGLSEPIRVRALALRADIEKDTLQAAGADKILRDLETANQALLSLLAKNRSVENLALSEDIHYTTLKVLMFLKGVPADEDAPLVRALLENPASDKDLATTLCTLAEREMRQRQPDWTKVANWIERSKHAALDNQGRANLTAFCAYQIAQAAWKRPRPDLEEALAYYQRSAQLAKDSDPAREAFALVRQVKLLEEMDEDAAKIDRVAAELGRVQRKITRAPMPTVLKNSFTARALATLHECRAQRTQDPATRLNEHEAAVIASAAPALRSAGDVRRLAEAAAGFLRTAESTPSGYLRKDKFIQRFGELLAERLGIDLARKDPASILKELTDWLDGSLGQNSGSE